MTALNKYQRLEASGLWRADADAQRREVIASIGDATLVISDMQDRPLAHWSIAAIERANPGKTPAVFHPYGDTGETLELGEGEAEMVGAIEKLRKAIHKSEPRSGRVRVLIMLASVAAVAAGAVFWLPDALRAHVTSVVPQINRVVIGQDVLSQMGSITGSPCHEEVADAALERLASRAGVREIIVVPGGIRDTAGLPGGAILVSRTILEDHEDPAVVAGYVAAEALRIQMRDPLAHLLETGGISASFRLLTTGQLTEDTLIGYAEALATETAPVVPHADLAEHFAGLELPGTPYAYAIDISGETTIDLIEADTTLLGNIPPVLSDGEWVALQEICTN